MTTLAPGTTSKEVAAATPDGGLGVIPFTVASRTQARYSTIQQVSNFAGATSMPVIPLPATGWMRRVTLDFTASFTTASAAAVVAGDAPWNLIESITLTDATGQALYQPVSGYNLYLINKYLTNKSLYGPQNYGGTSNPHLGPEYAFSASGTSGTARFRLTLDFEVGTDGYGCVPNLDSNSAPQLQIRVAPYTVAFTGTTPSAATVSVRVTQWYYPEPPAMLDGIPTMTQPPGAPDYLEWRYETKTVNAASENITDLTNRGGLIKGIIFVSRAAGARTDFNTTAQFGFRLDNQDIFTAVPLAEINDLNRRSYGYWGADLTTSYAPLSAGVQTGLDRGVAVLNFDQMCRGRDGWLATRTGSLVQAIHTPGASATQLEVITGLMQARNIGAFYTRTAI